MKRDGWQWPRAVSRVPLLGCSRVTAHAVEMYKCTRLTIIEKILTN